MLSVAAIRSKVTAQGQIPVPLDIRKKPGMGPGSVLEWEEEDGRFVVRRSGSVGSEDIHRALFSAHTPQPRSLKELKEGIPGCARKRHARG